MGERGCGIEHSLVLHLKIACLLTIALMRLHRLALNFISDWRTHLVASICHFLVVCEDEVDPLVHLRLGLRVVTELDRRNQVWLVSKLGGLRRQDITIYAFQLLFGWYLYLGLV